MHFHLVFPFIDILKPRQRAKTNNTKCADVWYEHKTVRMNHPQEQKVSHKHRKQTYIDESGRSRGQARRATSGQVCQALALALASHSGYWNLIAYIFLSKKEDIETLKHLKKDSWSSNKTSTKQTAYSAGLHQEVKVASALNTCRSSLASHIPVWLY